MGHRGDAYDYSKHPILYATKSIRYQIGSIDQSDSKTAVMDSL